MSPPIFPIEAPGVGQPVRGPGWSVFKAQKFSTLVQKAMNQQSLRIPQQVNPLWTFRFTYEIIIGNSVQTANAPYTDIQLIIGFYTLVKGPGTIFWFKPYDSPSVGNLLLAPDVNGYSELTHTVGGLPTPYSGTGGTIAITESVQALDPTTLVVLANGTPTTSFTLLDPNTVAGYPGYVLQWSGTPTGPITASYTYYYPCVFSDDSQEYEEFMYNLWTMSELKFEQVPL